MDIGVPLRDLGPVDVRGLLEVVGSLTEADWTGLYTDAGLVELRTTTGPFAMMTPAGFWRDEGPLGTARFMAKSLSRLAYIEKMAWLMPRMLRAMPYLGYVVVGGTRA